MSNLSPASILYDSSGNAIGVVQDNTLYRLQVEAKITGTVPLPTGAATESTLQTLLTESAFQARINTQGQKTSTASTPVVLASDQSSIPVTDDGGSLTVDNANLDAALSTLATQTTLASADSTLTSIDGKVATETTLASADSTLTSIDGKVATETTLAALAAQNKDLATQTTTFELQLFLMRIANTLDAIVGRLDLMNRHMAVVTDEDDPL